MATAQSSVPASSTRSLQESLRVFLALPTALINVLGEFFLFCLDSFRWFFRRPFRVRLFIQQFNSVGFDSLPIVGLVSLFTGMVFGLQMTYALRLFSAETLVGSTVGLALSREIAPVFAALMVAARIGSAMAAELGSMKVSEQIDALKAMAVYPHQYLVVPRVLAGTLMLPLLCVVFNFVGILGAYLVSVPLLGIPSAHFIYRLEQMVDPEDVIGGVFKAGVFGFLLASISCFQGMRTSGGARGVGLSTTRAVVFSSVTILVVDYFLTQLILETIQH